MKFRVGILMPIESFWEKLVQTWIPSALFFVEFGMLIPFLEKGFDTKRLYFRLLLRPQQRSLSRFKIFHVRRAM